MLSIDKYCMQWLVDDVLRCFYVGRMDSSIKGQVVCDRNRIAEGSVFIERLNRGCEESLDRGDGIFCLIVWLR